VARFQVIWLKKVKGPHSKEVRRLTGKLISADEDYCTVEINGERFAAPTQDVKLVKAAAK